MPGPAGDGHDSLYRAVTRTWVEEASADVIAPSSCACRGPGNARIVCAYGCACCKTSEKLLDCILIATAIHRSRNSDDSGTYTAHNGKPASCQDDATPPIQLRDTWEANEGSKLTATQIAVAPSGPGNLPYQLVKANPATGSGDLVGVSYIQRVALRGGIAPADKPCTAATKGQKTMVKYQADYIFWKPL